MHRRSAILVSLLIGAIGAGVGTKLIMTPQPRKLFPDEARQIFQHSEQFTLLSVNGDDGGIYKGPNAFHGYRIVGQIAVHQPAEAALIDALNKGISEGTDGTNRSLSHGETDDGDYAMCFSPHHCIRAVQGSHSVDLLVCFAGLLRLRSNQNL